MWYAVGKCTRDIGAETWRNDLDMNGWIILKYIWNGWAEMIWNGFMWLMVRTSGGLWTQYWAFGFCKMNVFSWLAEELLASQEALKFNVLYEWKKQKGEWRKTLMHNNNFVTLAGRACSLMDKWACWTVCNMLLFFILLIHQYSVWFYVCPIIRLMWF